MTGLDITDEALSHIMAKLNPRRLDKGKISLKTLKENYRSLVPPPEQEGPAVSKAVSKWKTVSADVGNANVYAWKSVVAEAKSMESAVESAAGMLLDEAGRSSPPSQHHTPKEAASKIIKSRAVEGARSVVNI